MSSDSEQRKNLPIPSDQQRPSSGISIAQLDAVIAVVDYGSFTAAADVLGISQPSLSRRIRALEEVLGMAVFVAAGRQMVLTDLGRNLLPPGRRMLHEIASIDAMVSCHRKLSTGTLRIAGLPSLVSTVLPPYLGQFHQKFPDIRVETFTVEDAEQLHEAVRLGRADAALGVSESVPSDLASVPLTEQKFAAVLPHPPTASGTPQTLLPEDLQGRTLVTLPHGTSIRKITDTVYRDYQVEPGQIITTTQRDALVQLSIAVGGVTIVPEVLGLTADVFNGSVARLRVPAQRSIGVLYRNDRHRNPALVSFLQLL